MLATIRSPMEPNTVARNASELIELLLEQGPITSAECCEKLDWPKGRFSSALKYAREVLCPELGFSIPAATPGEGWVFQVTDEWKPVEIGASYTLGLIETRLNGVSRDVKTILPLLEIGSVEWRRANFLNKHLSHILSTLSEIGNG